MESKERLIELQTSFSRKHIAIVVAIFIFMIVNIVIKIRGGISVYIPCTLLCTIILADVIISAFSFFHNQKVLMAVRFIETLATGLLLDFSGSPGVGGFVDLFVIFLYILFCVEIGYMINLSDRTYIYFACLVLSSPYLIKIVISMIKNAPYMSEAFCFFAVGSVSYVILLAIYSYISGVQEYNEQYIYAKDRMIDRAQDSYVKVTENQNNLMIANEQLGVKKFELEEAYKKINIINSDINFQNQIIRIASSSLDLNEVIHKCSDAIIASQGDVFFANIVFRDKNMRKSHACQLEKKMSPLDFDEFLSFYLSDAFIDEQVLSGKIHVNNDVSFDEFPFLEAMEIRSIIVKSIKVQSENFASVFVIMSHNINAFKDKETVYDNILRQIEVAANNIFMYSKITELSNRDGLSGLYNRRYLNLYFNEHFNYDKISTTAVAALIDIDHFKNINDTYGHLFGDQAIITVANTIKQVASANDGLTFRYGGEEFVVLFEDISLDDAVIIMERIRHHIKETPITQNDTTIYVNASIGVACYPATTKNLPNLIDRADKAMYYSKQNGRDRLTVDNGQD